MGKNRNIRQNNCHPQRWNDTVIVTHLSEIVGRSKDSKTANISVHPSLAGQHVTEVFDKLRIAGCFLYAIFNSNVIIGKQTPLLRFHEGLLIYFDQLEFNFACMKHYIPQKRLTETPKAHMH